MLDKLIEKAKKTDKRWWKWILGVLIALLVAFVAWRLYRMKKELDRLRVEKLNAAEKAKDLRMQAENEKNAAMAKALREEADRLVAESAEIDTNMKRLESDTKAAQEAVKNAKDWKELEAQARGKR